MDLEEMPLEHIWHWLEHAWEDTAPLIPFLLLTLFLLEYIEHRAGEKLTAVLGKAGRFGPAAGAALGCVPQCGFSVAAAHLYHSRLITAGTLVAVFLSTSDEALPILIAGGAAGEVGKLILTKIAVALIGGFALDAIWKKGAVIAPPTVEEHEAADGCDGSRKGIFLGVLRRTLSILLFLFLATFLLNMAIELIGEDRLSSLLLTDSLFQPFLAALFGFIPNCAASVLLTEFYLNGAISFGSAAAGLCTAAGVGVLELLRGRERGRLVPLLAVYGTAALAGVLLHILGA